MKKYRKNECACCGTVVICHNKPPLKNKINVTATNEAIIKRVSAKQMSVIKGDCPLSEMMNLIDSNNKFTVVQFLRWKKDSGVL